jgi:Leucine-rich repeat (LRR) protein
MVWRELWRMGIRWRLTSGSLGAIAQLRRLESLTLTGSNVESEGLTLLASLPRLQTLSLAGTAIRDWDLQILTKFPRLREVDLTATRVSPGGADGLRRCIAVVHRRF